MQFTQASNASFITGLSVVLVTLFTSFLNKKLPSLNIIAAILCAMIGLGLVTLTAGLSFNTGDLWVMLCAVCFAWYIIFAGKYTHEHGALPLTIVQIFTITVIAGILTFIKGQFVVPHGYPVWQAIIFCALFASVIAFSLQIHFQKYISTTKTAILFTMEPLFATIAAFFYLGEEITLKFVLGGVLIVAGMLLVGFNGKDKTMPNEM